MTDKNIKPEAFPHEPHDIPPELIQEPQDCIDFGTVEFDASTVVDQISKRAVIGECVVTGRKFEAVYLHRDPLADRHDITPDEPMHHYSLDRVWQFDPDKVDVHVSGVPYGQLREMAITYGAPDTTIGPTRTSQAPHIEKLIKRFTAYRENRY